MIMITMVPISLWRRVSICLHSHYHRVSVPIFVLINLNTKWVIFQLYHGENQGSNSWSTILEARMATITPSMPCWYTCNDVCVLDHLYQLLFKRLTIYYLSISSVLTRYILLPGISFSIKLHKCTHAEFGLHKLCCF